ncbi:solute carrier family 12 member 2-like [Falco biarmicus]|uniref:solute carrier family 12 member 2-like n=1 Tax=Falco biarmicus TaxID=345155 RepID=UPI0024BC33DE|nr:solute carrier family 12 member 2-like [Falco biarmicus]
MAEASRGRGCAEGPSPAAGSLPGLAPRAPSNPPASPPAASAPPWPRARGCEGARGRRRARAPFPAGLRLRAGAGGTPGRAAGPAAAAAGAGAGSGAAAERRRAAAAPGPLAGESWQASCAENSSRPSSSASSTDFLLQRECLSLPGEENGGWAEDAACCSSPGDAVGCTCLRLVEVVSAWPCSPRSACARGDWGARPGCGQELLRQELDRPGKGKGEVVQGHVASSCLLLQAPKSLPLRMGKDPPLQPAAGLAASVHSRVCA